MKFQLTLAALSCAALAGSVNAANVLVNPGFETGSLAPWFINSGSPSVTNNEAHTGTFSAMGFSNDEIRQNFAPVATSDITELSFWIKRIGGPFDQYSFYYSDAATFTNTISGSTNDWEFFDLTSLLNPTAHLNGFSIYGTSSGPAYMDDFMINAGPVPEPSSLAVMAVAFAGALARRRRSA